MLTIIVGVTLLWTALIWLGVGAALVRSDWRSGRNAALVLIPFCVALVVMGLAAGPEAYSRFRVPAAPFLAMLSGMGWFGSRPIGSMAPRAGE